MLRLIIYQNLQVQHLKKVMNNLYKKTDLSKSQIKMVHKTADKMPKKDFIKRYGKDADSVRFVSTTNMVKKKLGIEEEDFKISTIKGENMNEMKYKDKFKADPHEGLWDKPR